MSNDKFWNKVPEGMKGLKSEIESIPNNEVKDDDLYSIDNDYSSDKEDTVDYDENSYGEESYNEKEESSDKSILSSIYSTLKDMGFKRTMSFLKPSKSTVTIAVFLGILTFFTQMQDGHGSMMKNMFHL